jgi:hypothetical protein
MPTIQISQIILRSGPSVDLPGAPTSLTPLAFGPGLEPGEAAFMTDTGRIYIGHDPSQGQPNFQRAVFPYQNIEVLTENSLDTLQRLIGMATKEEGDFAYHIATLPTHTSDWEYVVVPRPGDEDYIYRLPFSDGVCATIDYAAYDADFKPVKMGTLTIRYFTGEGEPTICDEATVKRKTGLLEPEVYQPEEIYKQVDFRFIVDGPVGARYLAFQYKNRAGSVLSLRFKTSRPKV